MAKKPDEKRPFARRGDFMLLTATKPGTAPFWCHLKMIERVYPMNTGQQRNEYTRLGLTSGEYVVVKENADDILDALELYKEQPDAVQGQEKQGR